MTTRSLLSASSTAVQLDEKYFGENSKKSFVDTYRQLKRHGEILKGGYRELDSLIDQPMEKNVLVKAIADLELAGVLTPRPALGSPPKRPETEPFLTPNEHGKKSTFRLMDDDNESGTFLTKVGFGDDEDEPQSNENGASFQPFSALDSISELDASQYRNELNPMGSLDLSVVSGATGMTAEQEEEELATTCTYRTHSPRAIFLNGCLKNKIPPITIALVRRNLTSTINLAHMGIGDKIASILAGCLNSLPYLQVLNLADNNLTDKGLADLLNSAAQHKEIEELDISNNIVGYYASKALGAFLGGKECLLHSLRLRDANIDDTECANICSVLKHNKCLLELDLSKNLLGKDENLNVVKPQFVTGGESLADLLLHGDCPIQKLVLHWNMIRLDGALALCNAIQANKFLTHLDLSYNAIGSAGAEILGKSLLENKILKYLNVSNNGIDAVGCYTLCIGVGQNDTLNELNLDGNPVGVQGCMVLTKTILNSNPHLIISAQSCEFMSKQESVKFDISDCSGSYVLDMASSYQRAILIGLMRVVAQNPHIAVKTLEMPVGESGKPGALESFLVTREWIEKTDFAPEEWREMEEYMRVRKLLAVSPAKVAEIVKAYDHEEFGRFDSGCLAAILNDLQVPFTNDLLASMKMLLDPFGNHFIDTRTFCLHIFAYAQKCADLLKDLTYHKKVMVESVHSPGVKTEFAAPLKGTVKVNVVEVFVRDPLEAAAGRTVGMLPRKCARIIESAHKTANSQAMLTCALEGAHFYLEEARELFAHLFALLDDPVAAVAMLLPHMASTYDANALIRVCLGYDTKKTRRLEQRLGPIFNTITGQFSGFYMIDFSNPLSRICWKHLLAKSLLVKQQRKVDNFGELSQNGDGIYCFRNIHIAKAYPLPAAAAAVVAAAAAVPVKGWETAPTADAEREAMLAVLLDVSTIPKSGKIEFDFVSSTLHDPDHADAVVHTLTDETFVRVISSCQLLQDADIDITFDHLLDLMRQSRKMLLPGGRPYWKPSLEHAIAVGERLNELYNALPGRKHSVEMISKRESLEIDPSTDPKHVLLRQPVSMRTRLIDCLRTARAERSVAIFTSFLTTKGRSVRLVSKNTWVNRIRHMLLDDKSSAEFKSLNVSEYLLSELSSRWIYCRQLSVVVKLFQFGVALHSDFGSYRVELIVKLFDRIIDLHNFQFVLMHLNAHEHAAVFARIGILNIFNPSFVTGGIQLDISRWDERQVVKMLIHLSIVEPGENFRNEEYAFDRNHLPMPGWELKVTWLQEQSLPNKGVLSLEVYAGDGMNMDDCSVNRHVRSLMMALVLVRQRDVYEEVRRDREKSNAMLQGVMSSISIKENRLEYGNRVANLPSFHNSQVGSGTHTPHHHIIAPLNTHHASLAPHLAHLPKSALRSDSGAHVGHAEHLQGQSGNSVAFAQELVSTDGDVTQLGNTDDDDDGDAEFILHDTVMQLAYPQLAALENYESKEAYNKQPVSTTLTKMATTGVNRQKSDEPIFVGLQQSGSNCKFMKTYRLDDLHAELRARTNITWTYAPPQPNKPTTGRATQKGGT